MLDQGWLRVPQHPLPQAGDLKPQVSKLVIKESPEHCTPPQKEEPVSSSIRWVLRSAAWHWPLAGQEHKARSKGIPCSFGLLISQPSSANSHLSEDYFLTKKKKRQQNRKPKPKQTSVNQPSSHNVHRVHQTKLAAAPPTPALALQSPPQNMQWGKLLHMF